MKADVFKKNIACELRLYPDGQIAIYTTPHPQQVKCKLYSEYFTINRIQCIGPSEQCIFYSEQSSVYIVYSQLNRVYFTVKCELNTVYTVKGPLNSVYLTVNRAPCILYTAN